jgi:hypothetical protein
MKRYVFAILAVSAIALGGEAPTEAQKTAYTAEQYKADALKALSHDDGNGNGENEVDFNWGVPVSIDDVLNQWGWGSKPFFYRPLVLVSASQAVQNQLDLKAASTTPAAFKAMSGGFTSADEAATEPMDFPRDENGVPLGVNAFSQVR